jgi:predicted DCC family thiol-disulfide oxidoreductase YuxK
MSHVEGPILFFDGVCNLCSASVQFIIEHEAAPTLRFASLQSERARTTLPALGVDPSRLESLVLVEDGVATTKSTAAIGVAAHLRSPWRWLKLTRVVPRPVRDVVYDLVAANRYRLFGRKEACWLPAPELKIRFVSDALDRSLVQRP